MIFKSSIFVNLAAGMLLAGHPSGIPEFFLAPHILIVIVMAFGLFICMAITAAVCFFNNKKLKRETQKENEDAGQK